MAEGHEKRADIVHRQGEGSVPNRDVGRLVRVISAASEIADSASVDGHAASNVLHFRKKAATKVKS